MVYCSRFVVQPVWCLFSRHCQIATNSKEREGDGLLSE